MTTLSTATQISLILLGALATVGVVVLLILAFQIRRLGKKMTREAGPLLERSKTVATNLEYISAQVRTDVERLNGSVKALSDRLQQASEHMEDRINEFNALMEIVQGEAEGVFLDTAATVRGIRAGADELTHGGRRRNGGAPGTGTETDSEAPRQLEAQSPPADDVTAPEAADNPGEADSSTRERTA